MIELPPEKKIITGFEKPHVTVPHGWAPRAYQMRAWTALGRGANQAMLVWHRRAGKDMVAMNLMIVEMFNKPGVYWHLFPSYEQARKAIWFSITNDGRRFIDHFPKETIRSINIEEMRIELTNNSIYQLIGADRVNNVVGSNARGMILSEFSLYHPDVWPYLNPMLLGNKGWAYFILTPRGRNHAYDMYKAFELQQKRSNKWFAETLTVKDTGLITEEQIEDLRKSGTAEEKIQQEYFCSWDAGLVGAYYGKQMELIAKEHRVTSVPYDPRYPVHTAWDIGVEDATAIWFFQVVGLDIRCIDYYEKSGSSLVEFIRYVRKKPYTYGDHIAPHDLKVREWSYGKSRYDNAIALGFKFRVMNKTAVQDGIDLVRGILGRCYFDEQKCKIGLEALRQYTKKWDDKLKCFSDAPAKGWWRHGADAFRQLAWGLKDTRPGEGGSLDPMAKMQEYGDTDGYDPLSW